MHDNVIVSLIYSIYQTIREPKRWQQILKECEELVPADACDIAAYDFNSRKGEIVAHSGYYDEAYVGLYEREYAALNPWLRHKHRYDMDGAIWTGRDLCPPEQLIRTPFFNRWLRPQKLYHRICSTICYDSASTIYFSALRERGRDDFARHELHIVQKLVPHMRQVLELQRLLGGQKTVRRQPLLDVAHHVHDAVLVVGADGKIVGANPAGPGLLAKGESLGASRALWERITAAFETASGRTTEPGSRMDLTGPQQESLAISIIPLPPGATLDQDEAAVAIVGREIPRESSDPEKKEQPGSSRITWRPLVIHRDKPAAEQTAVEETASSEAASDDGLDINGWVHSLKEPCEQAEENAERLRRLYGFTQAEARLAILLACGYTLQDCAIRLGVSVSTVRTHLQRIFSKTDTHHQGQLVAILLAGPARLSIDCVTMDEQYDDYA